MAKIDELNAAIVNLQTTADIVVVKIDELKTSGTAIDPQLTAAIDAINSVSGKLTVAVTDSAVP